MKLNLRKRGSKWEYRFELATVNGKRKQFSKCGFARKKDAQQAGIEAMERYNKTGIVSKTTEISFEDLANIWLEKYVKLNCKAGTQERYKSLLANHIFPSLKNMKANAIQTKDVQFLLDDLKKQGKGKSVINTVFLLINNVYKYGINPLEYIFYNPCLAVRLPQAEEKKNERQIVTVEEFFQITNKIKDKKLQGLKLAYSIAFFCGLRFGEVAGLTWDNIDFEKKEMHIEKQLQKNNNKYYITSLKTRKSERIIKLNNFLVDMLKDFRKFQQQNQIQYLEYYTDYLQNLENNQVTAFFRGQLNDKSENMKMLQFVCADEQGRFVDREKARYILLKYAGELGIKTSFHMLRHSHATLLAENLGESGVKIIQQRLGHSKISTTFDQYVHSTEKMEEVAKNILDNIV